MQVDLSQLPQGTREAMDKIFREDFDLKVLKAIERQTKVATVRRDAVRWHAELKPEYEIDPMVDNLWRHYYGHNYTENPDLMRFLARRNPEIVTKARSPKVQVGYAGERPKHPNTQTPKKRGCRFDRGTLQLAK